MARLVYLSACAIPRGKGHFRAEIADIISACERNNTAADITGILIHDRGRFIQLLEGRPAAVTAVFSAIRRDSRHEQVTILLQETAGHRLMPDWSMAFLNAEETPLHGNEASGWLDLDSDELIARLQQARDELSVMRLPLAVRRKTSA